MYYIIGKDQKQYGPISENEVYAWITERRIITSTLIREENSDQWGTVGTHPLFSSFVLQSTLPMGGNLGSQTGNGSPPQFPKQPNNSTSTSYHHPTQMNIYQKTNPWVIAAWVFLSLYFLFCCCFPLDILALIFSVIALFDLKSNPYQKDKNLAIVALIISALFFILNIIQIPFLFFCWEPFFDLFHFDGHFFRC